MRSFKTAKEPIKISARTTFWEKKIFTPILEKSGQDLITIDIDTDSGEKSISGLNIEHLQHLSPHYAALEIARRASTDRDTRERIIRTMPEIFSHLSDELARRIVLDAIDDLIENHD